MTQFKKVIICETDIKLKLREGTIRTEFKFSLFKENEPFQQLWLEFHLL
jgi:hypothetical protein